MLTKDFDGIVVHSAIRGIEIADEEGDSIMLRCGSGEVWDDVVAFSVEHGMNGLENLSVIPGEVGASAVQNIGAYGKEAKDFICRVEAVALLTDGKDDFADPEYADFTAEMWSKGHSFFCYLSDSPDSLASCCRLRNSLTDLDKSDSEHNHTTHQYSMGTASVSTGSKSVMTINLNRLIQLAARRYFLEKKGVMLEGGKALTRADYDKNQLYEYIREAVSKETELVHKYQTAFNEIIKDFLAAKMLDVYQAGFIDMRRQYLTVGVNGLTDAAEFLGLTISPNPEYNEFVDTVLETINIANRKDKTPETMFNTEFVPGENLSGKNYNWDRRDGFYVSPKHNMYSSYFYNPEDDSLSMIDKFKLHGNEYVKHLDGGSALHCALSLRNSG